MPGLGSITEGSGPRVGPEAWQRRVARSARRLPPVETALALLAGAAVWYVVASFTEPYILPHLHDVLIRTAEIFIDSDQRFDWLMTIFRIMLGLVAGFAIGVAGGLAMGRSKKLANMLMPYLQIIQGIPSVAWVMITLIWFQGTEMRIWFLMLMITLPGFAFQAQDSYEAIPKDLRDMAKSLRPRASRLDMFRTVTLPGIVPGLLTAWKVNLGLGTRVVLIAEFAGSSIGVGFQLRWEQQFFRMDGVLAWTAALVIFVLIIQQLIGIVERRLLRYRPGPGAPQVAESSQNPQSATSTGSSTRSSTGRPGSIEGGA